jgi:hypothetical protein
LSSRGVVYGFLLVCNVAVVNAVASENLQPFTATYGVEWRGMGAGTSTLELTQTDGEIWTYRSRNMARGIFRLAFPQAITQLSVFRIRGDEVVPVSYRADDGSKSTARDVSLEFDWSQDRVTGIAENEPVSVPLQPGTQDAMSVQIALIRALQANRTPERFTLIDKDELKEYVYTAEGTARLETALGALDTIVYRSQREGSNRVTRLWLAPSLGYVPVRAQQVRKDRVEFTMTLRELKKG